MKSKIKYFVLMFLTLMPLLTMVAFPNEAFAASINVSAKRDDIYKQLEAAANVNVAANTFKKCISHIWDKDDSYGWTGSLDAGEIASYAIFDEQVTGDGKRAISASLWLEKAITGEATDSAVYCEEGGSNNVFKQFTKATDTDYKAWVCDGGYHGLLQRAYKKTWVFGAWIYGLDHDKNCNSFNDSKGYWLKADDAADKFKTLYTRWRNEAAKKNPFLPTYDEIGKFNNVDGYFTYINDFNAKCSADVVSTSGKQSGTDYQAITQYTVEDKKVKAKKLYYHVHDNKTWNYALSTDNPVKSCSGLLSRVSTLETNFNGIKKNDRTAGYAGNILAELEDACKNAKTAEGENGWTELGNKLQEIIDDPESSEDLKTEAQTNLDKLNDIVNNNKYVESSGEEDSDEGKVYQCADIDGLNINVEAYESGALDMDDGTAGGVTPTEQTCANSGGAASLGWIVCPVLDWMGEASVKLYDNWLKPALQIKPALFDPAQTGGASTQQAWGTFQAIANTGFIILFLIVIFSQLTGVGIDNYGIKRILPKLIVTAILVNLSYYICVIAVDLSNILGNALQAMFNNLAAMPSTIDLSADGGGTVDLAAQVSNSAAPETIITGVAILAGLVAMVGAIWANPAILLSLLVGALGVIISILFLFILLSAREAAIIVLMVLSPLAFLCYMLPNTKKLFDKWLNLGKGLLLVYPIAGLLVGGGNFVSNLLLTAGSATQGFVPALTAMIAGVIPIFFIPGVLKSSFAALGNLGAKISGFGDRMRSGADRKIRNSEGFKDRSNRWRAGVNRNGDMTRIGKLRAKTGQSGFAKTGAGRLLGLGGVSRSQARGMAAAGKTRSEDEAAGAMLINEMAKDGIAKAGALNEAGLNFGAGSEGAYYGREFLNAAARGDTGSMNSAIEAMRASNMKPKDIAKIIRQAQNDGRFNTMSSNARSAWMRDLSKRYGNDFLATDYELNDFAMKGGSGNLGGYGTWAKGNIGMEDIKPEDFAKMSGDSMAGMLSSGIVDSSMAQRAIERNPNLSADKKIMLGAMANGATVTDPSVFKREVEQLMKANLSGGATGTVGGITVTEEMRNAWTSVTPDQVNVVQNFNGGGQQFNPVDVKIDHEVKVSGPAGGFTQDDVEYGQWQAAHWEENRQNLERTGRDTTQNNPPRP
ncbi:MAG: hypothetical protein Q4B65_00725 [Candidatus Saccharibacteria bacterium]|nr:hypothetical protein [Candidatus Saccharibacteria bacterium]